MQNRKTRFASKATAVIGASALLLGALAACSAEAPKDKETSGGSTTDASNTDPVKLTWWTWSDNEVKYADAYTAAHPNVTIDVVKLDNPDSMVTKIQNAVKAGTGTPDIFPVEYQTIPQMAMGGALADLNEFGLGDYADKFTPTTWEAVNFNGQMVGLPMDSGPMVWIYNQKMFEAAGIDEVPTTWDGFAEAARKIKAHDPEATIANAAEAGSMTAFLWAAGSQPFKVDGENVTINLADPAATKWAEFWGGLNKEGLLSPLGTWSDEWSKGLSQDKIASVLLGSWMISGMADYGPEGRWQVAPMPSWDGKSGGGENGGSSVTVSAQSENKAAAAEVLKWLAEGEGRALVNENGFPSTTADLADEAWLSKKFPFYGEQEANRVGAEAAKNVVKGWQYVPFQGYANNVFGDSIGQAFVNKQDLVPAMAAWQEALVKFGNEQGFTINK